MKVKGKAAAAQSIRIFVLEAYEMFRKGLCLLLSEQDGFEIVGDGGALDKALPLIRQEQPDVIVVALNPENGSGIEYLAEVMEASGKARILVLSTSTDPEFHRQAVRLGAAGVMVKDKPLEMLVKAIRCINAGEAWLDRFSMASLLRELSPRNRIERQDPEERKIASLTDREREVIELIGKGFKNKQIAEALFISNITVHHHLTSIYSKLEVADRFELLIFAYRKRLAELPQ